MRLRSPVLLLVPAAFLGACASVPNDAASYSEAPVAPDGYATVYFYRVGAYPTLRKPDVLVSGVRVYEPPELSYTWVHLKAGDRTFRIEWAWDTKWPPVEFIQTIAAGESYYIKISGSFESKGFTHVLGSSARLVPPREAEAELATCCKYIKAEVQRLQ